MLVHRRHHQLRPRRRATQRRSRRPHRASLITNQPRRRPPLSASRTTLLNRLPRIPIQPRRTSLGLLIRAASSRRTTSHAAVPTRRRGRHRTPTAASGKHLAPLTVPAGREQPMTTSQQPINPSHKLRNAHPPKLTRANRPGHSQAPLVRHLGQWPVGGPNGPDGRYGSGSKSPCQRKIPAPGRYSFQPYGGRSPDHPGG